MNKFPIIIIGTAPRCGSTLYLNLLQDIFNLSAFSEPWSSEIYHNELKMRWYLDYLNHRKNNKNYIVKFWWYQLEHRSPYHEDMRTGYKILLSRRDIVAQIASWYIAEQRNKWSVINNQIENNYVINIDKHRLSQVIETTTLSSFYAENCNIFDKRICYEDLDLTKIPKHYSGKTKQPDNINELKFEIQKQMKDSTCFHWKNIQ